MGKSPFRALRNTEHDECAVQEPAPEPQHAPPPPKFAELTGAYWLEPIYTGLAQEWSSAGRTVPGAAKSRWRNMADAPGARQRPSRADTGRGGDAVRDAHGEPGGSGDARGKGAASGNGDAHGRADSNGCGCGCGEGEADGLSGARMPRR